MSNFKEDLKKVKAFVFDIDGVFTDGKMYCMADGEQVRSFNAKDGFAVRWALENKFPIGIITAGKQNIGAIKRLEFLGIEDIFTGNHDKTIALDEFCTKYKLDKENILYMGDDIPDFPILKQVGIPTCPGDASVEIKQISTYISNIDGGDGCVRDVIEQVLRAQGKWVDISGDKFKL